MNDENLYDKLLEIFGDIPCNLSILEEEIDLDLQMEYFEFSKDHKDDLTAEEIIQKKDEIFVPDTPQEDKKNLLVKLASLQDVEAYRTIEKYLENPENDLREWATLAFQESRMLLESKLLDENQVFISTGLGGKGSKLRYFTVIIARPDEFINPLRKRIVESELSYLSRKQNVEIEELQFTDIFITVKAIIPISIPIKSFFKDVIYECNQYGNFLQGNFIVTNVKCLTNEEIYEFIYNKNTEIEIEE